MFTEKELRIIEERSYWEIARNGEIWEKEVLNKYIDPLDKLSVFEIGTCVAAGTIWMSTNLCKHPESIIYSAGIDGETSVYKIAKKRCQPYDNIKLFNAFGIKVLKELGLSHDLIYVDGSHSYLSVRTDGKNSLSYLKESGIIIFDDYELAWPEVVRAVDDLISEYNLYSKQIGPAQILVKKCK